jgi:hypothetical protein
MHGTLARPSNIRTEIGERIADLRDNLKATREILCRAIADGEPEADVHQLRVRVGATLEAIDRLHSFERRRL